MNNFEEIKLELIKMRELAYSPYYKFTVGTVLVAKSGKTYTGCNIENITQGPGMCGERVAFGKALSEGEKEFDCIYIMGGPTEQTGVNITPCGVCRQFLAEFCKPDFKIINVYGDDFIQKEYILKDIFPEGYNM